MNSCVIYVVTILAVLPLVKNDEQHTYMRTYNKHHLQCWKCISDAYGRCGDNFNYTIDKTEFRPVFFTSTTSFPHITSCESFPNQLGQNGRQVCMKRVETDKKYNTTIYTRSCHYLAPGENVGNCSNPNTPSVTTLDFCEYCDTNECNGD